MAEPRSTMIDPPIEVLLDKVDSKFTLVTLAAKRGRQVNSYFSQLGEGLGAIVPPQVASIARKPLSIALEEIAAGKVVAVWPVEVEVVEEAELQADDTSGAPETGRRASPPEATGRRRERRCSAAERSRRLPSRWWSRPCRLPVGRHGRARRERRDRRLQGRRDLPPPRRCRSRTSCRSSPSGATRFVGEATFSALASEPARRSLFDEDHPIPHTDLGRRADLVLVAPATARVIGVYAAGISSDLLVATLLATRAPVLVCPAI